MLREDFPAFSGADARVVAAWFPTFLFWAAVHASVSNHFNTERSLYSRPNFKLNRTAALAEWRQLGAV